MSNNHRAGTTSQWRQLRQAAFDTFGRACMICADRATEIDHIIELADGGSNTLDNLQPLCKPCHATKTANYNSRTKRRYKPSEGVFSVHTPPPTLFRDSLSPLRRFDPPTNRKA